MKDSEYSQRRKAQNELFFRGINNRIDKSGNIALNDRQKSITPIEFVCECSNETCFEKINISLRDYEDIRNEQTLFILIPGHNIQEIENVIRTKHNFILVQKTGNAADEVKQQINK